LSCLYHSNIAQYLFFYHQLYKFGN
jgi:hypothetical protein